MKKRGFVERTLYGKDKSDFSVNDYPENRFQAFLVLLKTNWITWILISLLTTISFLPLYFLYVAKNAFILEQTPTIEENMLTSFTIMVDSIYNVISIPLWMIGILVVQGSLGLIRKMTFKEGFLFWSDFFLSIKSGFKNSIISSLIFSVIISICNFNLNYVLNNESLPDLIVYAVLFVVILIGIFNVAVLIFNIYLNSLYDLSIRAMYKNSLLLVFVKPLKNLLFLFIFLWPIFMILLIPNFLVSIIILCIMLVFITAVVLEIQFLYSCYLFDIYINEKHCPQIYRKGLKLIDEIGRNKKSK